MDGGINEDQNFYSRPPFPRPPSVSNDLRDHSRFNYEYDNPPRSPTYANLDNRPPAIPPKLLQLTTANLHATTVNGYGGGATGDPDSPAPDDFYRNFDAFATNGHSRSMTNGAAVKVPPSSSGIRQPQSSFRSNGNGTPPKHPITTTSPNGLKSTARSVSSPIEQRMASLNTAKSTSALNGYSKPVQQQSLVKDLRKKFDENQTNPSASRKPAFQTGKRDDSPSSFGKHRSRTPADSQPYTATSRPGLTSGNLGANRAKSPPVQRTQRARFVVEDQRSNNILSEVARTSRRQQIVAGNAQATQSMTNLSPEVPPKSTSISVLPRKPLFGEVFTSNSGSSNVGYGIVDSRSRRTSESSLHRPAWSRSRENMDDEPISPSSYYLADPTGSKRHNRSQSDFGSRGINASKGPSHNRVHSQSRLPVSSKQLAIHAEIKTPPLTRAASPFTATTPSSETKLRTPDQRPWSPPGRKTTPSHSRSPGRPIPGTIVTNSSLKAYISAPLPKTSPPLRSSRPRQPVSTATTASSRLKAADKLDSSQGRNGARIFEARDVSRRATNRSRDPSPSNQQYKAAAARATKAISRNMLEREQREAERRRKELESSLTASKTIEDGPSHLETGPPVNAPPSSPDLKVNTSYLSPIPKESQRQYGTFSNPDSPTLGMPGSFPDHDTEYDEVPQSAISAATAITEFDNEPQTELPQQSTIHQLAMEPTSVQPKSTEESSETGFFQTGDRGSIKIILDTTSLAESGDTFAVPLLETDTNLNQIPVSGEHVRTDAKTWNTDLYDVPITSSSQEVVTPIDATPIDTTPQTQCFDDAPFHKESANVDPPAGIESEKLKALAASPYQPPSVNLPPLNTGLDVDFGNSSLRPEYLETPITDIDYESSEAEGENAANIASKDVDHLAGRISTAFVQHRRSSQQSAWTDYTLDTNYDSWQDESPYPPQVPPLSQANRPIPPPKELHQSHLDSQFKDFDYGLPSSPRMLGETTTFPGRNHPSFNPHSSTNDSFSFAQIQSSPKPPVPAPPNHSPPLPPSNIPDGSRLQLLSTLQVKEFQLPSAKDSLPPSSIQQSSKDSESRRASEDADSSYQSQWTPRTSNQISEREREFVSPQKADTTRSAVLFGEEKEAAEKQARRLQHRGRVIKEIIDTEAVYLKDMNVVEEIYKGTAEACPKLEANDVNVIFRNTNEIVAFSTMFLDEIKAASSSVYSPRQQKRRQSRSTNVIGSATISPATDTRYSISVLTTEESDFDKDQKTTIGLNFGRHLQEMQRVYTDFLKSSERASSRLCELQTDGAVNVWLGECNHVAKDLTAAWDLDALLIKPVQRITRYQLLLKELLENTPEDHPDFQALKTTCREIGDLLKNIDDLKKRIDTVGKIVGVTRKRKESDVRAGLAKAFGRRDRAGTTNSNRPPDDEVYAKLHQSWGHDFIQLQIILRDVENYTRKAQSWVHDFLRYLSAIELVVRVIGTSRPELESKWARFSMSMRDIGTVALEDHLSAIRKQVLEPLEQVIKAYGPPELAMKKRTKRRLDFEKYLALKASNKKIDEKLAEMVEQYTALNETLKFELPKLSMLTMRLGKLCLTKLVTIQAEWYNIWQVKVRTVIEESDIPKDFADIIDKFTRDFKYHLKAANSLSIVNGAFLLDTPKSRSSQSTNVTKDDDARDSSRTGSMSNSGSSTRVPPIPLINRSRGYSVNSEHSPRLPTLPTPDFRRSSGHEFSFSPVALDGPGLPTFSTKDFPPTNAHSRAGSGSPAVNDMSTSRQGLSRPPTGRSYESGNASRKSIESNNVGRSPSASFSQFENTNDNPRDRPPVSSRPYSGLFHSAMPPPEVGDESQRSSRASSYDRDRSGGYNVLYIAASLFEFNISATKTEAGYPYLTYGAGEVFDVIGEKGELWLAKNQDDTTKLVGWIWSKHFARLATN